MTIALLATAPTPHPLRVGDHSFSMVPIPGGSFLMGDEQDDLHGACRPVHKVELDSFSLGQFPVTQALWRAVVKARPGGLDLAPSYFKGGLRPVEQVSWEDTEVFLKKLNDLLPGRGFRLPTEAEWEYAAQAGMGTLYSGSNRLETVGWYRENSHDETRPVGLKIPNAFGLYDMSGNVWEWCADWYDEKFYQKCAKKGTLKNPLNDAKGSDRVLRGGSWFYHSPQGCRVAYRNSDDPSDRSDDVGFRLAALPPSQWPGL